MGGGGGGHKKEGVDTKNCNIFSNFKLIAIILFLPGEWDGPSIFMGPVFFIGAILTSKLLSAPQLYCRKSIKNIKVKHYWQ